MATLVEIRAALKRKAEREAEKEYRKNTMDVVSLNRKHSLYHTGFRYAFRFPYKTSQFYDIHLKVGKFYQHDTRLFKGIQTKDNGPAFIGIQSIKHVDFILMS